MTGVVKNILCSSTPHKHSGPGGLHRVHIGFLPSHSLYIQTFISITLNKKQPMHPMQAP